MRPDLDTITLRSAADPMLVAEIRRLEKLVACLRDEMRLSAEEREALEIAAKILVSEPSINPAQRKEWAATLLGIIRKEKNDE